MNLDLAEVFDRHHFIELFPSVDPLIKFLPLSSLLQNSSWINVMMYKMWSPTEALTAQLIMVRFLCCVNSLMILESQEPSENHTVYTFISVWFLSRVETMMKLRSWGVTEALNTHPLFIVFLFHVRPPINPWRLSHTPHNLMVFSPCPQPRVRALWQAWGCRFWHSLYPLLLTSECFLFTAVSLMDQNGLTEALSTVLAITVSVLCGSYNEF